MIPGPERIWYVADAFRCGMPFDEIRELTHIDPWFLAQIEDLVKQEESLVGKTLDTLDLHALRKLKRSGFSDQRLAKLMGHSTGNCAGQAASTQFAPGIQAG